MAETLEKTANTIGTAVDHAIENVKATEGKSAKIVRNAVSIFINGLFGGD